MSKQKTLTRLEAIIDSLTDSLEIVSHNEIETNYVLKLRKKYEENYKELSGKYYLHKEPRLKIAVVPPEE